MHQVGVVRQVDRAGVAQQVQLEAEEAEQPGQRRHEAGNAEAGHHLRVDPADGGPGADRRRHGRRQRPAGVDERDRGECGGQSADRADGQVDLAHQQHAHHAERDDADGDALHQQVHEVGAGEEHRVQRLEDRPDDEQADGDRQRAQVAGAYPLQDAGQRRAQARAAAQPFVEQVERGGRFREPAVTHRHGSPLGARGAAVCPRRRSPR